MISTPWFKLYATDYLLDPDVDAIPRESEALLIRMWCICHIEGSCPADPEELARKTRCGLQYVLQYKSQCERLFELREGRFYSRRMEDEKRRSEQSRKNANKRYSKELTQSAERAALPIATQSAMLRSDYDSNSKKKEEKTTSEFPSGPSFNSIEVARILCQSNGWSGNGIICALRDAIDFQAKQMPEETFARVGDWLVRTYFEHKTAKGDFAVTPQKFFEQALYRRSGHRSMVAGMQANHNNPAEYALAQLETD